MNHTISDNAELVKILQGRAASYRLLSRLFLEPLSNEDIADLSAASLSDCSQDMDEGSLLRQGFFAMGQALRLKNSGTRQELATDFTMCFDGITAIDDKVASPYASVYLSDTGLLNQAPRREVYHIFLREALRLKDDIHLPEDHLSFELEFLAILSDRAAEQLEQGDREAALRILELSQTFIEEQILSWFGQFKSRADLILKTRFYKGLMMATQGYLDLDQETLSDAIEALKNREGDPSF